MSKHRDRPYKCSHSIEMNADVCAVGDDLGLSDLEPLFVCTACGKRGADVGPDFAISQEPTRPAPWSWRGFIASLLIVALSGGLQMILLAVGVQMGFVTFFPAVFVTGFVAGKPASAFAATLSLLLVWWIFLPPAFEFGPLTPVVVEEIKIFLLGSILLVFVSDLCREIVTLDMNSKRQMFIALCRRYGVRPFRYPRQRSTTIMVRAPRRFFDTVVWRQFSELHTDLWLYFEQTTERLIREAIHADTADAETAVESASLR